ncbi:alkaline phosphatase like protein [Bacillus sp. JCM 19046]|nr:alkaline phosphatase like protein [Bacillus sp. JCM 19045]GAF17570.1 alkaline phosphatase like protein [Bacillus sp. JCM 19046]
MDMVKEFIIQYGYFGVFFTLVAGILGIPIPDEVLLISLGYLSYIDYFHIIPTIIVALIGSFVGMSLSYFLGIKLGAPFLEKYGPKFYLSIKRQNHVSQLLQKHGKWIVLLGFFIPGVRHLTGYLSGISRLHYSTYAILTAIGSLLWAPLFIFSGYALGIRWLDIRESVLSHKMLYMSVFFSLFILLIVTYITYKHYSANKGREKLKG